MNNFYFYTKRSIYYSFIIIILLQLIFFCVFHRYFQLSWNMILLIYWLCISPKQVNIGTGFFLGLITDCMFSAILGTHAFSFSIISYVIIKKIYFFQNVGVLQQSFFVILFSLVDQGCNFAITFLTTGVKHSSGIFWNCLLDGIIWPFLLFIMHKIYLHR